MLKETSVVIDQPAGSVKVAPARDVTAVSCVTACAAGFRASCAPAFAYGAAECERKNRAIGKKVLRSMPHIMRLFGA